MGMQGFGLRGQSESLLQKLKVLWFVAAFPSTRDPQP